MYCLDKLRKYSVHIYSTDNHIILQGGTVEIQLAICNFCLDASGGYILH